MVAGHALDERHHGAQPGRCGGDEGDKEIGEAEVGAMDALLGDGDVGCEFLGDRGAIGIAGVDRLGAAVGLDAGEEQVAALAVDRALKPERSSVGNDLIEASLAAERVGHADGGWRR